MITGPKSLFVARCRERGYQLAEVMPCVVKQDGDQWTVDTEHPSYPKAKPGQTTKSPSIVKKATKWIAAIAKWKHAGSPNRTDEEVDSLVKICKGCEYYSPKGACRVCGCTISNGEWAVLNKARMATETCPKGKWPVKKNDDEDECINEEEGASMNKIDVMYPLGNGSIWNDNELRYSLRSMHLHFPNLGRVWIVGHKPDWLTNVEHIPCDDTHRHNKDANLMDKIKLVCSHDISSVFWRASDDQILLRLPNNGEMVARYSSDLASKSADWWDGNNKKWKNRLRRTYCHLVDKGRTTYNYDCHVPQPYYKDNIAAVLRKVNYTKDIGYTTNTLLLNRIRVKGLHIKNKKLTVQSPINDVDKIARMAEGKLWLGYNDIGLNSALREFIQAVFPNPCPYEVEYAQL